MILQYSERRKTTAGSSTSRAARFCERRPLAAPRDRHGSNALKIDSLKGKKGTKEYLHQR
jgi:hypothetical protein